MRVVVTSLTLTMMLVACGKPESGAAAGATEPQAVGTTLVSPAPSAASLTRVEDASQVCMVNDHYMGKPQIPVTVGSKTYFGCCAMCKQKLETDPGARTALDPVTGRSVDKASAVIGRDATGKVYYFENEATMARFR